jgi:hypothetical protein
MYGTDLFDRLRDVGWLVDVLDVDETFGPNVAREHALLSGDGLIVGRKPSAPTVPERPPESSVPGS